MDNQTMLSQTIHFQRTAWQNSMAIISAVQEHGEKLLKTTLQQSPWMPGNSKKACLYWVDIWTKNLAGMTDLVDQNLAEIERLSSTGDQATKKEQPQKKASAKSKEPAQPAATAKKPISKKKTAAAKPHAAVKQMPPTKPAVELSPKPAAEHAAAVKETPHKAPAPEPPPAKLPAVVEKPNVLKT